VLFNLTDDPWISVRTATGERIKVSLIELFERPGQYADLDARPGERIGLMRLLICITQAAIGAPKNRNAWEGFGGNLSPASITYLHKHREAFNLLGKGQRFLQQRVDGGSVMHISKLIPGFASGNNPTWNDHGGGDTRPVSPEIATLALLAMQNCAPLFGRGYKGRGPCTDGNMLHAFRRGANIRELILNNCLDQATIDRLLGGMGHPIWEKFPVSLSDAAAVKNATTTYLGRLVPLHRSIWIHDDLAFITVSNQGWEYPAFEFYREPSATILPASTKPVKPERVLPARLGHAIWRDLAALLVMAHRGRHGSPLILQSHVERTHGPVDIWTGAVITDFKAKMIDTIESVFHIPSRMLTGIGHAIYERGVAYAENWPRSDIGFDRRPNTSPIRCWPTY
jgi:CRISPR system Cascade subunit CasA